MGRAAHPWVNDQPLAANWHGEVSLVNPLTRSVAAPNVHRTDRPAGRFDRLGRLRCQKRQRVRVCFCALGRRLVTERDGKSRRSLPRPLVPLASYLDNVRPIRPYGAIEFHKWGISRRVTARCVAAVEEREPYLIDVYSEMAGAH